MAQRMVKVQNMVNKTVSVKKPEYGINRRWTQKGQIIPLPYEAVEQMLWNIKNSSINHNSYSIIPEHLF